MFAQVFWSSVVLTGNPTDQRQLVDEPRFWSSVVLTGNPTYKTVTGIKDSFGAVSF